MTNKQTPRSENIASMYRDLRPLLIDQAGRTPEMTVQDYVKLLYQSEFGGGHLIDNPHKALDRLRAEARSLHHSATSISCDAAAADIAREQKPADETTTTHGAAAADFTPPLVEPIGSGLARLHLQHLFKAAGPTKARPTNQMDAHLLDAHLRTLHHLFVATANTHQGSLAVFQQKLIVLQMASEDGLIPLDPAAVHNWLTDYAQRGWPMLSHSETYRQLYQPAYRVIRLDQARFFDLYCQIDHLLEHKDRVIVAIDGSSGTGKSTLASQIASIYDCAVYHMDDYFLRPEQRTPQRLAEPGGNVDRQRFQTEVIDGVLSAKPFTYRPFDCRSMAFGESVSASPSRLTIIEGVYSLHPDLRSAYDWKVCLRIERDDQLQRILQRGGEQMLERFKNEWIPLEDHYLNVLDIEHISDQVFDIEPFDPFSRS